MYGCKTFLTKKDVENENSKCFILKHFGNGRFLIFYSMERFFLKSKCIGYRVDEKQLYVLDIQSGYMYCIGGNFTNIDPILHYSYTMYDSEIKNLTLEVRIQNNNGNFPIYKIVVDWKSQIIFSTQIFEKKRNEL